MQKDSRKNATQVFLIIMDGHNTGEKSQGTRPSFHASFKTMHIPSTPPPLFSSLTSETTVTTSQESVDVIEDSPARPRDLGRILDSISARSISVCSQRSQSTSSQSHTSQNVVHVSPVADTPSSQSSSSTTQGTQNTACQDLLCGHEKSTANDAMASTPEGTPKVEWPRRSAPWPRLYESEEEAIEERERRKRAQKRTPRKASMSRKPGLPTRGKTRHKW